MPSQKFFKFGTNVHLDSRMNWLNFGGQRWRLWWPHKMQFWSCELDISVTPWGNLLKFSKYSLGLKSILVQICCTVKWYRHDCQCFYAYHIAFTWVVGRGIQHWGSNSGCLILWSKIFHSCPIEWMVSCWVWRSVHVIHFITSQTIELTSAVWTRDALILNFLPLSFYCYTVVFKHFNFGKNRALV